MNEKQHSFVTEYLRMGDKISAYRKAYNCYDSSYRSIESAANRLLNNTEVATAIVEVQNRIRNDVEFELKQELRTELLTVQRKRELLALIATGEMWVEQHDKGKDCKTCTRMVRPTINQMLKAIDLDSKLAGHYTNKKQLTVVHASQPSRHAELDSASRDVPNEKNEKPESQTRLPSPTGEGQGVRSDIISVGQLNQLLNTPLQKETQLRPKLHITTDEKILKE